MRQLCLGIALLALLASPALAQGPGEPSATVRMSASARSVEAGAIVTLEVRADAAGAQISDVAMPTIDGFEVVARHVTQPMRFTFGRGGPEVRATIIHQVSLRALRPGRFTFSPAVATVGGQRFKSNTLSIEVTGSAIAPSHGQAYGSTPPASATPGAGSALDGAVFDPDVFLRTVVDKPSAHVGEQVTVTIYLYTTVGGQPSLTREASTDGFWVHDLVDPNAQQEPMRQVVHGIPFRVYVLRRFAAFPLREGKLSIGAPVLRLQSSPAFGFGRRGASYDRSGVPVELDITPLPPPAPAGAVTGRYTVNAKVDRTEARVGDAVTYTLTVEGVGDLHSVRPAAPSIPGVRVLEPEIDDQITTQNDLVGGKRSVRFLLLPDQPGTFTIPSIRLDYFDPVADQYGAATTPSFDVKVTGTPNAAAPSGPSAPSGGEADESPEPEQSVGALRPKASLEREARPVSARPWYRWALAAPPLLWLLVLFGRALLARLRRRRDQPSPGGKLRAARARLDAAKGHQERGDARAFYGDITAALTIAAESRLGIVATGLTRSELESALYLRAVPNELTTRILQELESCDFARFSAAGADADEMARCAQRARALIDRLDALPEPPRVGAQP